jgi:hypothetical protein
VRGDESQPSSTEGEDLRERRAGRHAAPRKWLLTKLHIHTSKAIVLAAMPTAMVVGMGLSPKLSMADDNGDIPFAAGPCVTRSDQPSESAKLLESPNPSASASSSPSADKAKTADTADTAKAVKAVKAAQAAQAVKAAKAAQDGTASTTGDPKPLATPPVSPSAGSAAKKSSASSSDQQPASATPSPSTKETSKPLDLLGIGGVLSLDQGTPTPSPTPSASESSSTSTDATTTVDQSVSKVSDTVTAPVKKTVDDTAQKIREAATEASESSSTPTDAATTVDQPVSKVSDTVTGPVKKTVDDTAQKIRDAAAKAGESVQELPADAKGLDPTKDTAIPDGAKPSYPCPTADPKALAAADRETGIPSLPDDPWILKSSMLTLNGLDYKGIVEVRTGSGKIKKVLKFTSSSMDIKDLHQLTVGPDGSTGHVKAASGSTSTIRNGTLTMYTESLKGNLFGLIPITFSPETPPPVNLPFAVFTNVTVKQAGQFGGTLTVPGLQSYFTGS